MLVLNENNSYYSGVETNQNQSRKVYVVQGKQTKKEFIHTSLPVAPAKVQTRLMHMLAENFFCMYKEREQFSSSSCKQKHETIFKLSNKKSPI